MAIEVTMPQLSDTMNEGTILTWRKKEGDKVVRGDALAEVATDKADLEIESFHEGTLLKINSPAGSKVKVGSVIAVIGEAGEVVGAPTSNSTPAASPSPVTNPTPTPPVNHQASPTPSPVASSSSDVATSGERIKISPLARNVADTHGIDYSNVHGSGEGGRIVRRDIEMLMETAPARPVESAPRMEQAKQVIAPRALGKSEPLSTMRATIASRMVESVTTIPHFYVTSKIVMDEAKRMRNSLKELPQYEGLTFNHVIVRAAALALQKFPGINSSYQQGNRVQPSEINIGIVTAIPGGLLIPVVKQADQTSLADIVGEARSMIQRARAGKPKADDLVGGTFSISNMGMHAVESFTAIISPGQGAILAISAIDDEPIVVDGQTRVAAVMRATLSVDHRIIDGVMAGEFLTELRKLLQDPVLLLA